MISVIWNVYSLNQSINDWWYILTWEFTHWGRVTHICASKLTTIDLDNGLSPGRRQAIIWTNDGIFVIWPLGTNFNEMLIAIHIY